MFIQDILYQRGPQMNYIIINKIFKKMAILVKTHKTYRLIIAVCDCDIIGKHFEQGNKQLDLKKDFYEGDKKDDADVIELLKNAQRDDATFNIVGKNSVNAAIKAGIVSKKGIMKIQGIPYALCLL